jgi:hypothetical protein
MKHKLARPALALAFALVVIRHPSFVIAQGTLTPPGAPAPTMKTLDQVEARTPISSAPFTINASGSYYLTGNLAVTTGSAITISADDVTLDLNGFTISSTASPASGAGVRLSGVRRSVTVRNGGIRGTTTFASGAFTTGGFLDGIDGGASGAANLQFSDVSVAGVGDGGIITTLNLPISRNVIERCRVSVCGGAGIRAGTVRDCQVDAAGATAIQGTVVVNCFGESVGTSATNHGIVGNTVVENCRGIADAGNGVSASAAQVSNSFGTSESATGLAALCATNCHGLSTSGSGLFAPNAHNCYGETTTGTNGINGSVISFCRARRDGGVAITCFNAIGCFVTGTGTVTATNKSLGTP